MVCSGPGSGPGGGSELPEPRISKDDGFVSGLDLKPEPHISVPLAQKFWEMFVLSAKP